MNSTRGQSYSWFNRIDKAITEWMARYGITLLRVSVGIVFLWFGVLKFFPNLSPAQDLATHTISVLTFGIVPPNISLPVLAAWEVVIGLGLISGTVSEASSREGFFATALLHECYGALDRVGAASETDAERIIELGAEPSHVTVTGDTRYDQVWRKAASGDRQGNLLAPLASSRPTVVAGSTWPSDEEVLFQA